jgi:LPS-assembly lipoprotein
VPLHSTHHTRRAWLCSVLLAGTLVGCGFQLRSTPALPFDTIAVTPERGTGVAADIARYFGASLRPAAATGSAAPDAILDIVREQREKLVVGVNASGQVREYQLRLSVTFRLRTPQGREVIPATEIEQRREISFSESAVLAKEAEEVLLYRDMQSEAVQQLLRRLSAVKRQDAVRPDPGRPVAP